MIRIKEKKTKQSFGLVLSVASLLALGGILASSILKDNLNQEKDSQNNPEVLGRQEALIAEPTLILPDVNTLVQETISSTQNVLSEKALEVKGKIIKGVEKEVSKLTQNQIETLKLQICSDWGVVTPTAEKNN